jgi:hypothetical protein
VLAGAQSEAVTLSDVTVEEDLVITMGAADAPVLDAIQIAGFLWFELLISASYLGMASALAERVLAEERGAPADRVAVAGALEAAMSSLEGVAVPMADMDAARGDLLTRALLCRYATQDAINRAVALAEAVAPVDRGDHRLRWVAARDDVASRVGDRGEQAGGRVGAIGQERLDDPLELVRIVVGLRPRSAHRSPPASLH